MLFRETVAVYCENYTEHTDTLCGQNAEFSVLQPVVHITTTPLRNNKKLKDLNTLLAHLKY
jgi:hypothetical protein